MSDVEVKESGLTRHFATISPSKRTDSTGNSGQNKAYSCGLTVQGLGFKLWGLRFRVRV